MDLVAVKLLRHSVRYELRSVLSRSQSRQTVTAHCDGLCPQESFLDVMLSCVLQQKPKKNYQTKELI